MKYLVYLLLFLIISLKSSSQELTLKDCKLTFDDRPFSDSSTIIISQEDLLKLTRLRTSFSWAKIKSYTAYPTGCWGLSGTKGVSCNLDTICSDLKWVFERMPSKGIIEFDPIVTN